MKNYAYSITIYGGLLLTVLPAFWGVFHGSTVDSWPPWFCLGCGLLVGVGVGGWRYHRAFKQKKRQLSTRGQASKTLPDTTGARTAQWMLWFLGPACWVLAAGLLGNRFLDRAEPAHHTVTLIRVEKGRKYGDRIHLTSWRAGEDSLSFRSSHPPVFGVHRGVPRGTRIVVSTKPGAFGWEWVVRIAPKR